MPARGKPRPQPIRPGNAAPQRVGATRRARARGGEKARAIEGVPLAFSRAQYQLRRPDSACVVFIIRIVALVAVAVILEPFCVGPRQDDAGERGVDVAENAR